MKIRSVLAAAAIATGPLAATALGVVIRHDIPDDVALSYGSLNPFKPVGRMIYRGSHGLNFNGSGTLISPTHVLTAAHVVDDPRFLDSWHFDLGGGKLHKAKDVSLHPNWTGDLGGFAGDLAIVELETPVQGVTPAMLATGQPPYGQQITIVGFGGTGDGLEGWDGGYDLERRAGTNILEPIGGPGSYSDVLITDFDAPGAGGDTFLESMLMFGDSGGAQMALVNNQWELIGVNSFLYRDSAEWYGQYGQGSGATSVFHNLGWINSFFGAELVPTPSTALALASVGLIAARRRR